MVTSLTNDDAVRDVALGDQGVRAAIRPDAVYADASTVSPDMSEQLAASFPQFVAMPILGAPAAVEAGKATYLAGGDPAVVARLEPMLVTLSDTVRRYDTAAKAGSAKLASNLMLLAAVVQSPETGGVTLTTRLSIDTHPWLADHDVLGTVPGPGEDMETLAPPKEDAACKMT